MSAIKDLILGMRKLREKEAWLIYSCSDGTYDSHLVIGTQEDCKAALQKAMWDGGDKEIPDYVTDTLKNFMDPENWGMDYGEWIEEGEQYYIGVKRVCNFTFPTNQERLEKALEVAVEALEFCDKMCLCDRFKTPGFDYGETHRRAGQAGPGKRFITPRDKLLFAQRAIDAALRGES